MKGMYWGVTGAIALAAILAASVAVTQRKESGLSESNNRQPLESTSSPSVSSASSQPSAEARPSQTPAPTPEKLSTRSTVTITGLGSVQVGMTVSEASAVAGVPLVSKGETVEEGCRYYEPAGALQDVGFMVTGDRIARVDILSESPIKTRSGLGNGSTKAQIQAAFPGQIEGQPHEYTDGQYLIFVPKDKADQDYRIVFETDNQGRVLQYRAGKLPEVLYPEGCS